jgi:hypothetical protein
MVRRDPTEVGGDYFRILPGNAGRLRRLHVEDQERKEGLDLNRNYPAHWRQEHEQMGAGPYPTSEPEVRAQVHFLTSHPNIGGGVSFHTWSGVLLQPFDHSPDEDMVPEDLWVYKKIGVKGTELTLSRDLGLPRVSLLSEAGHRRNLGLAVRPSGRIFLGGRDLVADARSGHREISVHRLVPRSSNLR